MRRAAAAFVMLTLVSVLAPIGRAKEKPTYAPLPTKIIEARAVYIDNQTARAQASDELFQGLTTWGRFKVVADKKDADLIFTLTAVTQEAVASNGSVTSQIGTTQVTNSGVRRYTIGTVTLTIRDARDESTVWANTKPLSRKGATRDLVDDLKKRIAAQEKPQRGY